MADEMDALAAEVPDAGCRFYALAARALNQTIDLAHNNRLTRQQAIMFDLADMMTYVEVGVALARKAVRLDREQRPRSGKIQGHGAGVSPARWPTWWVKMRCGSPWAASLDAQAIQPASGRHRLPGDAGRPLRLDGGHGSISRTSVFKR
jgi:alkylation response protein AidB-like acyl-CoA dehydrogenase